MVFDLVKNDRIMTKYGFEGFMSLYCMSQYCDDSTVSWHYELVHGIQWCASVRFDKRARAQAASAQVCVCRCVCVCKCVCVCLQAAAGVCP